MRKYNYNAAPVTYRSYTLSDFKKLIELHTDIYTELKKGIKALEAEQEKFPKELNPKIELDSLTLLASDCKHKAISLMEDAYIAFGSVEADLNYCKSLVLIDKADEVLKDKGFDKVTDSLRSAAVSVSVEIREFEKAAKKLESLKETAQRLVRAFENDEFSFKEMAKRKNTMGF